MTGVLDGMESEWDSPGLGVQEIEWWEDPVVGERFVCERTKTDRPLRTSTVQEISKFDDGRIRFRTMNSMYMLTPN